MIPWRLSKTSVPGSGDKGQPEWLRVQLNQISRGKCSLSILCHQNLFQWHWEVTSAQAVSFSLSVTRIQDICQVISAGSFWPAHSTNIQFEEKSAHKALNYDIFILTISSSLETLSLVSALQTPNSPHTYRLQELVQTQKELEQRKRVCAVPNCSQTKP